MKLSYKGAKRLEAVLHNWFVFSVLVFIGVTLWGAVFPMAGDPGWTWKSVLINTFLSFSGVVWYISATHVLILAVTPHHVHKVVDCSEAIKILDAIRDEAVK